MNQDSISYLLSVLKEHREELVNDFLQERADVFIPMFAYEDDSYLMQLSIDRYFIGWINQHFSFLEEDLESLSEEADLIKQVFIQKMLLLLQSYIEVKSVYGLHDYEKFVLELLREKRNALGSLLKAGERASQSYNQLLYYYEKDKRLFQRQLEKLLESI